MVGEIRKKRIESELLKAVSHIIYNLRDNKINNITITEVILQSDLKKAFIKYTSVDYNPQIQSHIKKASRFIRKQLPIYLELRYIPEIVFIYDKGMQYQKEMDDVFKEIENERNSENNKGK